MPRNVLVVLCAEGPDGLAPSGKEALGAGAQLARRLDGSLSALLLGLAPASAIEAGERGAERIFVPGSGGSEPSAADAAVAGAAEAARAAEAGVIIVDRGGHTLDLVPRLAQRLGGGCVMGVTEIRVDAGDIEAVAAIYGGAARGVFRFRGDGPRVLTLGPGAAEAPARAAGRTATVVLLTVTAATRPRVTVIEPASAREGPRLEDARIVVSGGRGLKRAENVGLIRELAAALGGMPGASRAIVDDGWANPSEQVGLTGKIVAPDLYFAIGISGASQHMAGCSNARTIVAINTDPDAPIFRHAHLGIVGNCLDVLPELIRLAKERSGEG